MTSPVIPLDSFSSRVSPKTYQVSRAPTSILRVLPGMTIAGSPRISCSSLQTVSASGSSNMRSSGSSENSTKSPQEPDRSTTRQNEIEWRENPIRTLPQGGGDFLVFGRERRGDYAQASHARPLDPASPPRARFDSRRLGGPSDRSASRWRRPGVQGSPGPGAKGRHAGQPAPDRHRQGRQRDLRLRRHGQAGPRAALGPANIGPNIGRAGG